MSAKKFINIGFRVNFDENERLDQLVARVKERNPHMDKSKVIRELIGFDPARFIKNEDRESLGARPAPPDWDGQIHRTQPKKNPVVSKSSKTTRKSEKRQG